MEFDWVVAAQLTTGFVAASFAFFKALASLIKFFGKK